MERYYKKWFFVLALPAMVLFMFVILVPFVMGVVYSFTSWRGTYFVNAEHWYEAFVGFKNYIEAFRTEIFVNAFIYTIKYTFVAVISINIISLLISLMLTKIKKGTGILRAIFFMPNLLGGLALGFIWSFIFEIVFSRVLFGPEGIIHIEVLRNMTQNTTKAMFAMVIMATWQLAGYMMLIYINGLNNIPSELYEAAEIDGASSMQRFGRITVPMLMPSFTIVFFLTLSHCFKMLDMNVALTDGDFNTRLLALQILRTTRDTSPPDYGLAQAQAVIFFILIAFVTLIQVSVTKKREVEA